MSEDSAIRAWGSTEQERAASYPCDEAVPDAAVSTCRAIDIEAPPEVVFRWLCQLRVGPYSYDLLDNLGRRSPRKLVDGLQNLELGQKFMMIYELVDFEQDRQITVRTNKLPGAIGVQSVTYQVTAGANGGSRLLAKRVLRPPRGPFGPLMKLNLPVIDYVMAMKQLKNFKKLAERQAQGAS